MLGADVHVEPKATENRLPSVGDVPANIVIWKFSSDLLAVAVPPEPSADCAVAMPTADGAVPLPTRVNLLVVPSQTAS
jgi:hypothetical protein